MCLSADWAGMLVLSNSILHCFVLCVWVRGSRSCICSRLLLSSLFRLVCCLCASRVVFFSWCCGAPFFCCCCSVFLVGCRLFFVCPCVLGACGLARSLLVSPLPPHPPWLVLCAFWSSQCSAGPSLRVSGCICNGPVVIPSIWRVVADWLLSSLLMATKASALCGALPSPPCCGCCSGASRTCTEVFALG